MQVERSRGTRSIIWRGWSARDDHADILVITESRCQWMALTQYLYFSLFLCCVRGVEADSFREGGGALCVCRVCWLAFQIMKCSREQRAGGPYSLCRSFILTPVSLWFFHTLFLVCTCVFMFVRAGCCVYVCPLLLLLVFCMADPPNVITVSACLIYSRRE